jgi:hypothetical protein
LICGFLGLSAGLALGWRALHPSGSARLSAKVARDFATMMMFGLFAAACLAGAVAFGILTVQALADQSAYASAPTCASAAEGSCLSRVDAVVVRIWADSTEGPDWIEVTVGGHRQTIEIDTRSDIWKQLIPDQAVQLTSWRGKVTQVTWPGRGSMQTSDSPGFGLLISAVFLGACLFGLIVFTAFGLVYRLSWRTGRESGPHLMTASGDWA